MKLPIFKLENFFQRFEFSAPYMLGSSDAQSYTMQEILAFADSETNELWNKLTLNYTESPGLPLLRQEISKLYKKMSNENITVCSGAEEAIFITMQVLLDEKSHAIVITPCYQSLKELPKAIGAQLTEIALDPNNNWNLDLNLLKNSVRDNTKLIIINFPHNPTSYLPDRKTFDEIILIAKSANAYLFSDEVYRYSEQNGEDRLPSACECYERAISLGVMSKSFGLAGLRIGWVASEDKDFLNKIEIYKHYLTICNSAPSEILAVIALRAKEIILKRNLNIIHSNLELLDSFFKEYKNLFTWHKPRAGITAFPRLKLPHSIDDFVMKLVEDQGVLLLPGSVYDFPGNYFRIGFGRSNMPEVLNRLRNFIETL